MNLKELLSPIKVEDFVTFYKGENYFIHKGDSNRFKTLLTWDKLNEILQTHRIDYPRFRMIKDGKVIDPSFYVNHRMDKRQGKIARLNLGAINEEIKKGTAIHILSIEEFSCELEDLCREISSFLFSSVSMTAHIGMCESKGLDLHWDSHDVFVIQLYGKKRWRLFGFTENYPFREGPSKPEKINNDIVWEGDLTEGDILYLPRGIWHEAQAYSEPCMHISIGMHNPKVIDYLKWLNVQMLDFEFFRKDVPVVHPNIFLEELKNRVNDFYTAKTYQSYLNSIIKKEQRQSIDLPNLK